MRIPVRGRACCCSCRPPTHKRWVSARTRVAEAAPQLLRVRLHQVLHVLLALLVAAEGHVQLHGGAGWGRGGDSGVGLWDRAGCEDGWLCCCRDMAWRCCLPPAPMRPPCRPASPPAHLRDGALRHRSLQLLLINEVVAAVAAAKEEVRGAQLRACTGSQQAGRQAGEVRSAARLRLDASMFSAPTQPSPSPPARCPARTRLGLHGALLQEAAEGRQPGARPHHDHRRGGAARQLEGRVPQEDGHAVSGAQACQPARRHALVHAACVRTREDSASWLGDAKQRAACLLRPPYPAPPNRTTGT